MLNRTRVILGEKDTIPIFKNNRHFIMYFAHNKLSYYSEQVDVVLLLKTRCLNGYKVISHSMLSTQVIQ